MVPYETVTISPDKIQRTIGKISGEDSNKSIIFFGGIHGNEPAGIIALQRVLSFIEENKIPFSGKFWALQGNLPALKINKRFLDEDLNRIWYTKYNDAKGPSDDVVEFQEKEELTRHIQDFLNQSDGDVFFFDLHTTSSHSVPFISISDTLKNREVIEDVPVPIVLGLEEQMEGTLFSFFSELGISMALFEAGQHDSMASVDNNEAFVWLMLAKLGFINKDDVPDFYRYYETLAKDSVYRKQIFQLKYSHPLNGNDEFKMIPGYVNFQPIHKNEILAEDRNGAINSPMNGRVFMPLYQNQGGEGFFIIEEVKMFWLKVSERFRLLGLDRYMHLLPGVKRDKVLPECFIINVHVAAFFVLDFFHLLGFRKVIRHDNKFIVKRRPFDREQPSIEIVKQRYIEIVGNGKEETRS
jgi:succinylglutamate desuccinylase